MTAPACECPVAGYCPRHKLTKGPRQLELCRTRDDYREMWDRLAAGQPGEPAPARPVASTGTGPGAHLKAIFAELGFESCPICNGRAAQMDVWGPAACRERFEQIVGWLREKAASLGWGERFKLLGRSAATGWALRVNWFDPIPSLLEEAIRRSEAEEGAA